MKNKATDQNSKQGKNNKALPPQIADKDWPIRINRYLFLKNYCSRREADKFIEEKRVKIDGKVAKIGQKVERGQKVEVDEKIKQKKQSLVYFAFNKPEGVVSHNPQHGEKSVEDFIPSKLKVSPIGRLDKKSHGLMILSNDGTIVDRMLNPKFTHEKEYEVEVDKRMDGVFMHSMEKGVNIEGYKTKQAKLMKLSPTKFILVLTEGKKHQIRRMCAALGYQIVDLKRTRMMNVRLGKLKKGKSRQIEGLELLELFKSIGREK